MSADFSARHVRKQNSSNFPWGIVIACLLFLSFLLWNRWDKITHFFSPTTEISTSLNDTGFVIGDPITLEGLVRADGDFMTHTHTLLTQSSGVFGLKSKTINLSQYTGNISIDGTIAMQSSGLVIIEVAAVMDLNPVIDTGTSLSGDVSTGQISTGQTAAPVSSTGTIEKPAATTDTTATKNTLSVQEGVQQVPVTIGTGTLFISSRGHTILFPSKKISFQGLNLAATDFGVKGLRCYAQTNVIDYANKANITTAPSVKIFECTHKTDTFPSQFASIVLDDGRVFLIEATDPAWANFANAIEITATVTN